VNERVINLKPVTKTAVELISDKIEVLDKKRAAVQYVYTDKVLCKLCSTPIMTESEINGKVMVLPNGNYQEFTIQFKDGSAHETAVCSGCYRKSITPAQAEALWAIDVKQWMAEDKEGLVQQSYWDHLMSKQVKGMSERTRLNATEK
jgi:hypothetical protein